MSIDKQNNETNRNNQNIVEKGINKLFDAVNDWVGEIEEEVKKEQSCKLFTMNDAFSYLMENRKVYPQLTRFVLSVKPNPASKRDTDRFIITQVLLDVKNKPVVLNGGECLSRIINAGSIDKRIVTFLDGAETKIYIGK